MYILFEDTHHDSLYYIPLLLHFGYHMSVLHQNFFTCCYVRNRDRPATVVSADYWLREEG